LLASLQRRRAALVFSGRAFSGGDKRSRKISITAACVGARFGLFLSVVRGICSHPFNAISSGLDWGPSNLNLRLPPCDRGKNGKNRLAANEPLIECGRRELEQPIRSRGRLIAAGRLGFPQCRQLYSSPKQQYRLISRTPARTGRGLLLQRRRRPPRETSPPRETHGNC
jgi:hypothetical protein